MPDEPDQAMHVLPEQDPRRSRLARMVPRVGSFFTPLRLVEAFGEYDEFFALSRRRYVPPNFAEMRHVLNIAQVCGQNRLWTLLGADSTHIIILS